VIENANEGNDTVYASVNHMLAANVENLVLQGGTDLQGTGNGLANAIFGNSGANTLSGGGGNDRLDGGAGVDVLKGDAGNDTFVFHAGEANGDVITDFVGNGAATGDSLQFVGYGAEATFTNIDATHWQVNFNGGASHEIITFLNGAAIVESDFLLS
jgi:Ca2+-binding RTX toxin-like protein